MGMYENDEFRAKKKEVRNAYPSDGWKWRVDHMKDSQVLAIWFSLQKRKKNIKPVETFRQITLFDICPEAMAVGR